MKRLLKNKKALSPVVAAIILIAVTVAVSIAVAAWMGSLTIGFMETAEVTITDIVCYNDHTMDITAINTGTSDATVTGVKVNGVTLDLTQYTLLAGGTPHTFTGIEVTGGLSEGSKYSVSIFAKDGTLLSSNTITAHIVPASP
ncbi:MAG: archaellin/type IV pilin N-terminal domain-containing protein [archaeon]|jgi:archaeal type IV pilus assembly protein PilA